jgi:succinate dehydrogenase hydrophobic anchor subunit
MPTPQQQKETFSVTTLQRKWLIVIVSAIVAIVCVIGFIWFAIVVVRTLEDGRPAYTPSDYNQRRR